MSTQADEMVSGSVGQNAAVTNRRRPRQISRGRRRLRLVLSGKPWLPHLRQSTLFIVGGVVTGLLALSMAFLADWAQFAFSSLQTKWPKAPLIVTPLGFAFIVWTTRRFAKNAKGSGIPQVIAAGRTESAEMRQQLVSIRSALMKIILLTVALCVGASAGREGPTVQVGAAVMFSLAQFIPRQSRNLLLAGSAAGIAAAFNAPLAGMMFCIEELSRSFDAKATGLMMTTIFVAGITSIIVLGDYTYFGRTDTALRLGAQWLAVPLAGAVGGIAGGLFSRVLVIFAFGLPGRLGRFQDRWPILFAAFCGLLVAFCVVSTENATFGTGYDETKAILAGSSAPAGFGIMKFAATTLTSISGIPGGFFSPSLAVGAGIGYSASAILPQVPLSAMAILCMAAYLAGVTQAPITSMIIVGEMTANHALIFPIMLAALIASAIARALCRESVYHSLSHCFDRGRSEPSKNSETVTIA